MPMFVAALARRGRSTDAWQFGEAYLARGLLDDLTVRTAPSPKEHVRWQRRSERLGQIEQEIRPLLSAPGIDRTDQARLAELVRERTAHLAESVLDAAARSRKDVYTLERIQKSLPADAALVFWIDVFTPSGVTDPRGYHWGCVVRRGGAPAWFPLVGTGPEGAWTEADDRLPGRLRDALAHGEADWPDLARRLRTQRLKSLEPALGNDVRHLVVVPAGRMAGVPVGLLTDKAVSYAPSGTVYARLREQHRPLDKPTLLALGDPAFNVPTGPPPAPPDHGLLLTVVLSDGNGHKAGLRSGDVLLRYGDTKLTTLNDLKVPSQAARYPFRFGVKQATGRARAQEGCNRGGAEGSPTVVSPCRELGIFA